MRLKGKVDTFYLLLFFKRKIEYFNPSQGLYFEQKYFVEGIFPKQPSQECASFNFIGVGG